MPSPPKYEIKTEMTVFILQSFLAAAKAGRFILVSNPVDYINNVADGDAYAKFQLFSMSRRIRNGGRKCEWLGTFYIMTDNPYGYRFDDEEEVFTDEDLWEIFGDAAADKQSLKFGNFEDSDSVTNFTVYSRTRPHWKKGGRSIDVGTYQI